MVAAQDQRGLPGIEGLEDGVAGARADVGYLLEIAGVGRSEGLGFGNFDLDVAAIGHVVAEGFQAGFETGHADGRRAHVHAAAAGAHVQGNAEDANLAGGEGLQAADGCGRGGIRSYRRNIGGHEVAFLLFG